MTKTPKAYRDNLAKDLWAKRKEVNEQIKRIENNPDFLDFHKNEAIKVAKDRLYKELDDARVTEEYKDAKSKKQALREKEKDVKKQQDLVAKQTTLLEDKKKEFAIMNEDYGKTEDYGEIYEKAETLEKEKIKERLLNKPNMTAKDKEWMQKVIDYLVETKMDTLEDFDKLDAIAYTQEYIEIWGVKRARKDISAEPDGKNIFQHGNVTYFKRSEEMIKEQNKILAQQGMEIPLDSDYEKSLKALPGKYSSLTNGSHYIWWFILAFITDMSFSDFYAIKLYNMYSNCRWSASSIKENLAIWYYFDHDEGMIRSLYTNFAIPIRPVFK